MHAINPSNDTTGNRGGLFGTLARAGLVVVVGIVVIVVALFMAPAGSWLETAVAQRVSDPADNWYWEIPYEDWNLEWLGSRLPASSVGIAPLFLLAGLAAAGKVDLGDLLRSVQASLSEAFQSSEEFIQRHEGAASRFFGAWLRAGVALAIVFGGAGWFHLGELGTEDPEPPAQEHAFVIFPRQVKTTEGPMLAETHLMVFATVNATKKNPQASLCGFVGETKAGLEEAASYEKPRVVASVHHGGTPQPGGHFSMLVPKDQWWDVKRCPEPEEETEETELSEVYWHSIGLESPEKETE